MGGSLKGRKMNGGMGRSLKGRKSKKINGGMVAQ